MMMDSCASSVLSIHVGFDSTNLALTLTFMVCPPRRRLALRLFPPRRAPPALGVGPWRAPGTGGARLLDEKDMLCTGAASYS
jgi:hypothetical protein